MTRLLLLRAAVAALTLFLALPGRSHSDAESAALHVRVRADLAACLRPAAEAFANERGVELTFEAGAGAAAPDVDVLVADGRETSRVVESGLADEDRAVVVGKVGRTLTVTALPLFAAPHPAAATAFLGFLADAPIRAAFEQCLATSDVSAQGRRKAAGAARGDVHAMNAPSGEFAKTVVDSWIPKCSAAYNLADYDDPSHILGQRDAVKTGPKDSYTGITSLGQGGYVVVDMGRLVPNQAGDDIRIYQMTSGEPVTLYGATSPDGPFTLIARQRGCGETPPKTDPLKSNHCDFDLAEGQLASARYFKIEDGEIYPCVAAGTVTEGADIDAIEVLEP